MKLKIEYTYQDGSKVTIGYRDCEVLNILFQPWLVSEASKVVSMRIMPGDDDTRSETEQCKEVLIAPDRIQAKAEKKPSILDVTKSMC